MIGVFSFNLRKKRIISNLEFEIIKEDLDGSKTKKVVTEKEAQEFIKNHQTDFEDKVAKIFKSYANVLIYMDVNKELLNTFES